MRVIIKVISLVVMFLYLLVLSKLILFKYLTMPDIISHFTFNYDGDYWNNHNFIPFKTIIFYLFLADINFNIRVENLVGNIIGFAPFAFILPLVSKRFRLFKKVIIATFCLSLTFELIQFVFKFGSFDVDDLILNTICGILGYISIHAVLLLINNIKAKNRVEILNYLTSRHDN
ncbi:VanZ family protein [Rossellomorea sp. GCM10028870]|uniref:VanZ family protein n=1 Tax=Rossellomorea sp. GCM10028870 TaxID=3273426 RepID=UPI00360A53C8